MISSEHTWACRRTQSLVGAYLTNKAITNFYSMYQGLIGQVVRPLVSALIAKTPVVRSRWAVPRSRWPQDGTFPYIWWEKETWEYRTLCTLRVPNARLKYLKKNIQFTLYLNISKYDWMPETAPVIIFLRLFFFRDIFASNEGYFTFGHFIQNKNTYPMFFTGVYLIL